MLRFVGKPKDLMLFLGNLKIKFGGNATLKEVIKKVVN